MEHDIERISIEALRHDVLRLLPRDTTVSLATVGQYLLNLDIPEIDDVIATEAEALVCHRYPDSHSAIDTLKKCLSVFTAREQVNEHDMRVDFDGPDIATVCEHLSIEPNALISMIRETPLRVAMFGFLPGFAYLTGLPKKLQLQRKSHPAQRVPPGTFALGGGYAGVYPVASPGGWWQLGRAVDVPTTFNGLFTPEWQVGDRIQIVDAAVGE